LPADFSGSFLHGANLQCKNIETAIFSGVKYDKYTIWPKKIHLENLGLIFE